MLRQAIPGIAESILRDGIASGHPIIAHQSIVEFVASTTRGAPENRILEFVDARHEAEELMASFTIIYPDESVLRMALRRAAAYGLLWFDAHIWAYAEVHGIRELLSEDFQHGRIYGNRGESVSALLLNPAKMRKTASSIEPDKHLQA